MTGVKKQIMVIYAYSGYSFQFKIADVQIQMTKTASVYKHYFMKHKFRQVTQDNICFDLDMFLHLFYKFKPNFQSSLSIFFLNMMHC